MSDEPHSPASDARSRACEVLRDALHAAPSLAAMCREFAERLECHGEQFSNEQRAAAMDTEALHKALPLMAMVCSAASAFTLARIIKRMARRLESLPSRADELEVLMRGDEANWKAFENLVCGEGKP